MTAEVRMEQRRGSEDRGRWNRSVGAKWRKYLDVGFDLDAELLEVLYDGAVDRTAEVGVLVSDDTSLVADGVVYVLSTQR